MPVSKAQARAQAGFLKHQHHLLGVKGVAILARIALNLVAQLEDGAHLGAGEIGDGAHVFAGQARGGGEDIRVLLDGKGGTASVRVVALLAMNVDLLRWLRRSEQCLRRPRVR